MKITLLSGATRIGSFSHVIALKLLQKLQDTQGIDAQLINNRELALPLYEDNSVLTGKQLEDISNTSALLKSSNAIVLISPEYNGGMSGGLKNTLDYFRPEYSWKPMALVSVTSGTLGGQNAMHQMTQFASYVGACLMPNRLMVSEVQAICADDNSPQAMRFQKNSDKFLQDLQRFTKYFV